MFGYLLYGIVMKKGVSVFAASAASVALLSGCAKTYKPAGPEWQQPLGDVASYWGGERNVGSIGVKVVAIGPGESFDCGRDTRDNSSGTAATYCWPSNTIAVFSETFASTANKLPASADINVIRKLVVAHEYGHALQNHYDKDSENAKRMELQADCLGGVALNALGESSDDPQTAELIAGFYEAITPQTDGATTHGLADERYAAFVEGQRKYATGGAACDVVPQQ